MSPPNLNSNEAAPPPAAPPERASPAFNFFLLALSALMFWQSYRIAGFTSLTSAGVFPMLASAVMFGTAALNIWRVHRASPDAPAVGAQSDPQSVFLPFVLLMIGYLLALPWLGFVVASGLFLLFAFRILGSHRWGINLLIVCAALLIILLIFQTIFSVILPAGVLKGIVS